MDKKEILKEIAIVVFISLFAIALMLLFLPIFFIILIVAWVFVAAPMYSIYNHTKLNTYLVLPTVWLSVPIIFLGLIEPAGVIPPLAPFWAGFFVLFGLLLQGIFVRKEYETLQKLGIARKKLSLKDQLLGKVPKNWDKYDVIGDILDSINS